MVHEESFAFFVRIPYLWFGQNSSGLLFESAENEMNLSEYQSEIVNCNLSNTETTIKICHAWFVILNNRKFLSSLYFFPSTNLVLNRGSIDSRYEN
jgi:hypothetical protein